MWDKIVENLSKYPSAILTGPDPDGYPFSARCLPQPDPAQQVLRVQFPPGAPIQPGPAGLMCHYHDDNLWNLLTFQVRGVIEQDEQGWVFHPRQMAPVTGGLIDIFRFIVSARRSTTRYLVKRGLPRPKIPWDEIDALKK